MEKICTKCDETKPLNEFHVSKNYKLGHRAMCIVCERVYRKHWNRACLYGVSRDEFEELVAKQNGRCAICDGPPLEGESLCVDHDHRTSKVRGLLCKGCNVGLGRSTQITCSLRFSRSKRTNQRQRRRLQRRRTKEGDSHLHWLPTILQPPERRHREGSRQVVHAWYDEEKGGIWTINMVDKVAYPKLARGIEEGYITGTSMGCQVQYSMLLYLPQ
jgi:hypothetical protein